MPIQIDKTKGYVILWRSIMDTPIFSNPRLVALYSWVLLRGNYKNTQVFPDTEKIDVQQGQFVTSISEVAKVIDLKSRSQAKKYIDVLKREHIIDTKPTNKYTVVTVLDWNDLQNPERKTANRSPQIIQVIH